MSKIDISKLDFNTPLFGPVSNTKSEPKSTSVPSAEQNDTNTKSLGQKRKIKIEDDDHKEDDSDSGSGSGSGSNNSSGSGSDSDSDSGSASDNSNKSKSSENKSGSEGSETETSADEKKKGGKKKTTETPSLIDTDSQESQPPKRRGRPKKEDLADISELWQENPDLYGVRRSGRCKKEPTRYNIGGSDSDEEPRGRRGRRLSGRRKSSNDWGSSEDDSSDASSVERFRPAPRRSSTRRGRKPGRPPARAATKRVGRPRRKAHSSDTDLSESEDDDDDDIRRNSNRRASQKVRAHHRQNTITKMIRNKIGRHSVHDNLEKMATSQHSLGFGQVYANGSEETGFLSAIPLMSENSLRHDPHGETYNNGAFAVMESMWWDYTEVTVKRFHRDIDSYQGGVVDLLINEIEHIGKLRHPHILTLMGVCQTNNLEGLVLIYERIGQGSLFNYLHQKMERLPSQAIQDIAIQMCNAIIFIHLRGLVHCAITSHAISVININTFKLGNFEYMVENSKCELGKKNAVATNTNENCVYNWLAPEVIFSLPPSYYCDMYSYCAVLWELFHGDIPWENQSSEAIRAQYSKGNGLKIYQTKIPEYYKVFMEYGLESDPNKRKLSFLHVRDLMLAAPKDATYYLKTHFQNLTQNEHSVRTGTIAKQMMKPTAPQVNAKQEASRSSEPPATSKVVDQSVTLRDKHERRKLKEKERAKHLDDSDNEQNYEAERQKQRREEENRRIRKRREAEARQRTEERKLEQQQYNTGTRQVKGQKLDDHNKNCSATQNCWTVTQNLDKSPRKPAETMMFQTEGLDWEILPKETDEEYLYTVQVKRHQSPSKKPMSPLKTAVRTSEDTAPRPPCTPPRKTVIEVTSSEDVVTSGHNSKEQLTGSSTDSSQFARGRELGQVTSSMGRFSFLNLDNHQRSRSSGAKPACHTVGAKIRDEYSTLGKLTTAGSLLALYNEHSPDLPMGQHSHREPPDYATLRKRFIELRQPSAPPIQKERTWFEGKGSVRDLAKVFQQQIQEHNFYQAIIDGKLGSNKDLKEHGDTGESSANYGNHAKSRGPTLPNKFGLEKDDKESFGSLSTVTMSEGEMEGRFDTDTTSTFTSTSVTDSKDITLSTSTESDLVSKWVDHEIRKIKRNMSSQVNCGYNKREPRKPERSQEKSPDVFRTYEKPETNIVTTDCEDSSPSHVVSASSSDQPQHLESGDYVKGSNSVEEFYFDDELYARRGKKSAKIYFDDETSIPSVISESPQSTSLPMDTVLKANSMSSVEDRSDVSNQKQNTNRKKLSKIPTSRSKLASKKKSPEGVYSNIVTVKSSLDDVGVHQVTHKMKNLKTGGTTTLVNDTVKAQKVVTTLRSTN